MSNNTLHKLGIDIGSTTVKVAVLDENDNLLFSDYERHFANIRETLSLLVEKAYKQLGDMQIAPMITGSGGLTLAKHLDVPFVQEVISVSTALQHYAPQTDVAIELGGCKDHLFRGRQCGTAYERYLCRWYRFFYRPDGIPHPDRCDRAERIRKEL